MNRKVGHVTVWENVGDIALSEILPWCLTNSGVDTLLFTSRKSFDLSGKGGYDNAIDPAVRKILGTKLIASFEARGWPGTKLINNKGRVYVSELDDQMVEKIAKIQNNLFTWLQKGPAPLPEDLCVFKRGAKLPVLISHSVDREAFVISENCPQGFNASSLSLEDLNIWSGKYFCRI